MKLAYRYNVSEWLVTLLVFCARSTARDYIRAEGDFNKVSKFVSWCFEPNNPQKITSGLCFIKRYS